MNLRDLRYLIAVAELKHFGQAALRCNVSQPTLSMQIKKLEDYLGVKLIERTSKHMMITPVGDKIVELAKSVIEGADDIRDIAKLHQNPFAENLELGIIPTVAPYFLPHIIPAWQKEFPELAINIKEGKTITLCEELKSGVIDAAIMALTEEVEIFSYSVICHEDFFVAVPEKHKLAKRKSLKQSDLKEEQLLLLEDGHCLRDQALEACHFTPGSPEGSGSADFRSSSLETIREMVKASHGITIMPAYSRRKEENIKYIPFDESPAPGREIALVWRPSSPRISLLKALAKATDL